MSKAQIKTLFEQINSGNITSNEAKILEHFIERQKMGLGDTLDELHSNFMMKESTIVARLSALEDKGLIYKTGNIVKKNSMTPNVSWYSEYKYQPIEIDQWLNRKNIYKKKYQKWIKSGLNRFTHQMGDELQRELENELKKIIGI